MKNKKKIFKKYNSRDLVFIKIIITDVHVCDIVR